MKTAKPRQNIIFSIGLILFIISPYYFWIETSVSFRDVIIPFFLVLIGAFLSKKIIITFPDVIVILFWMEAILATVIARTPFSTTSITYLLFAILFIFITSREYSEVDIARIIDTYLIASTIVGFLIVLSAITHKPHSGVFYLRYSINVIGVVKNPNYLVAFLVGAFTILVQGVLFCKATVKKQVSRIIVAVIIFSSCILTGTRSSWLALAGVGVLTIFQLVFLKSSRGKRLKNIILLILVCLFFIYIVLRYIPVDVFNRFSLEDSFRSSAWKLAYDDFIRSNFITGFGINGVVKHIISIGNDLHSMILQTLFDQGICGIILLIMLICFGLFRTKKSDRFFLYIFYISVYYPFFFNNGCSTVSFWFPIIITRLFVDYSLKNEMSIIDTWGRYGKV